MTILGYCLAAAVKDDKLLLDFGFSQKSYVISLFLFAQIWLNSVDFLYKIISNYSSRKDDYEADLYAVTIGYGPSLRCALIRNFTINRNNIFVSSLQAM